MNFRFDVKNAETHILLYHAEIPFEARVVHSEAQLLTRQKILVFLLSSDCEVFRRWGGSISSRDRPRGATSCPPILVLTLVPTLNRNSRIFCRERSCASECTTRTSGNFRVIRVQDSTHTLSVLDKVAPRLVEDAHARRRSNMDSRSDRVHVEGEGGVHVEGEGGLEGRAAWSQWLYEPAE